MQINLPHIALFDASSPRTMHRWMFIAFVSAAVLLLALVWSASPRVKKILSPSSQAAAAASVPSAFESVKLISKAAIVIDIKTGKVLYGLNPDTQLPLASLTKVPMALAVSEVLSPDTILTIPYNTALSATGMRLAKGSRWKVQDVVDFTLVASSNEGAQILADAADSGLHQKYPESTVGKAALWRMNDLAKSLGLEHTYFLNVNGLDLSTTQSGAYGSARDMAKLFAYAASANPSLFTGTRHGDIALTAPNGRDKTSAINTNESQGDISGLILGKTGYTDLAGGNLAVVFDIGLAHPVVAVVLGSSKNGRFEDMQKLIEAARADVTAGL